jgi:hypothetical protein
LNERRKSSECQPDRLARPAPQALPTGPEALPACYRRPGGRAAACGRVRSGVSRRRGRDRISLGDDLVDRRRPSKPEADSIRPRLDEAKREAEALAYAEERAARVLDRLPREHKDEWLRAATRSLDKARAAYTAAIGELDRARDQLSDEATLLSFLQNDGQYVQALTGAIQRPGVNGSGESFNFSVLVELMREEAAGVEEKARHDPNRPQPEPAYHQAYGGGSKSWG